VSSRCDRFQGKVAIVTGAAQGMGEAIARKFAAEGAKVVVADMQGQAAETLAQSIRDTGGDALALEVNVVDEKQVDSMVAKTIAAYGTVDILVNNAGVLRPTAFEDISEAEWDFVMDVNVKGVFLCSKAVLPVMKAKSYGKIVNQGSLAGKATSTLGGAHYTTSKAAVHGLTRHLAREAAPYLINVNAVCPGVIGTPMALGIGEETLKKAIAGIPFGRLGKPGEVADAVLFLASDEASFITGAALDIHGAELIIQ
jgi:NAD(P)-dependent dehydrogenase (short-subunit alcohol dehydrogenase family)